MVRIPGSPSYMCIEHYDEPQLVPNEQLVPCMEDSNVSAINV